MARFNQIILNGSGMAIQTIPKFCLVLFIFVISVSLPSQAIQLEIPDDVEVLPSEPVATFDGKPDPMMSRIDPFNPEEQSARQMSSTYNYILNPSRLAQIRSELLYPFYDQGGHSNIGDYQQHIKDNSPQVTKHLNFLLPFFGFGYNYTWVSIHGFLAFSDGPTLSPTYPLTFPIVDYPKQSDPSFIGPFYSKCKIGELRGDELDPRRSGVYFRVERDLMGRTDQLGVEIRERLKWDIREGIVGSEWFEPRHAVIVTWKNVTFAGGTIHARKTTNTFQLILATDETRTYAIYNYKHIGWTTHTEAGGSSEDGTGGTPAFIGFNAGNGTRSYEYKPYSQTAKFQNILSSGNVNNLPGRHIFRIDEKIMSGQCIPEIFDMAAHKQQLSFAPESGNLLGGTIVNVTGPCFDRTQKLSCRFNTMRVPGAVIDKNRATCIMPRIYATGYIDFFVEVEGSNDLHWKGKFLVETPFTAPELVTFPNSDHLEKEPQQLLINWDYKNLTLDRATPVSISLWGYRENTINPEIIYLESLGDGVPNTGEFVVNPKDFHKKMKDWMLQFEIGIVSVNITYPSDALGIPYEPVLWSRPIPLSWYLLPSWKNKYGRAWSEKICEKWIVQDRLLKNFASDLPICPCNLEQALADKGRFLPDQNCDKDGKVSSCYLHYNAKHCVRSAMPTRSGSGQQCCYDMHGYLMMTMDNKWGGRPGRAHDYGHIPWNEASKVPSLSHYLHDVAPFFPCCMWEHEHSWWCMTFRFERRVSQNCVGYQPPAVGTVFGDPHIYTFDGLPYTFNGRGEFVLVKAKTDRHKFDVQGRFEQLPDHNFEEIKATVLTAVAAKDNQSVTVEVRLRPRDAQWRYKLDVIVDNHRVFFDRYPQKIQIFPGVTVYTPTAIQNQSHVIALFESGAGVEVIENMGHMTTRVYLPMTYLNQTRGLFGNWSGTIEDDFVLPDGTITAAGNQNLDAVHNQFALHWMVDEKETDDKGYSLFYHENGKTSSSYNDKMFRPILSTDLRLIIPYNVTLKPEDVEDFCGESLPCKYDYSVTLNREYGHWAKYYQNQFVTLKDTGLKPITSCGALMTPIHGRKSTFKYTPGTKVEFDCDPNFVLVGERRRECLGSGEWNIPSRGPGDKRTEGEWLNWNPARTTRCIEEGEHAAVASAKTAGIVLGILLPILIFVAFLIFWCRRMYEEDTKPEVFYTDKLAPVGGGTPSRTGPGAPTYINYRRSSGSYPNESSAINTTGINNRPENTTTSTLLTTSAPPPPPPPVTGNNFHKNSNEMVTRTPIMENVPILESSPRSSRSSLSRGSSRMTDASSTGGGNENRIKGRRRKNSGSGSSGRRGSRGTPSTPVGITPSQPKTPTSAIALPSGSAEQPTEPQPGSSPNQQYDGVYYTGEPIPGRPDHIEFRDEVNDDLERQPRVAGPGGPSVGSSFTTGLPRRQDSSTSSDNRSYVSSTIAV